MKYRVIVPIQAPDLAMPRSGMRRDHRAHLSLAFATDTLAAVHRCRLVADLVVVSPDAHLEDVADRHDAAFVLAPSNMSVNDAVDLALNRTRRPTDQMVATIVSDLPAVQHQEVQDVLAAAGRLRHALHVTDLGHGNVTLHAEHASTFTSGLVGGGARGARPRGDNHRDLSPGVRCDVDTEAGLRIARFIGVGPATNQALIDLDLRFVPSITP